MTKGAYTIRRPRRMLIQVKRYKSDGRATLSRVYVGGRFQCYGLEDEHREVKVAGETRIPAGEYPITLRIYGGFHERYKKRFADIHEGMLWVREVPGFTEILIHVGNTEKDTEGCLLVGMAANAVNMMIYRSVDAYRALYKKVLPAARAGALRIRFEDHDR